MEDLREELEIITNMLVVKHGYSTDEAVDDIIELFNKQTKYLTYEIEKSNDKIINYIEKDAEIAIPINELMREDGTHLTKKEYGLVLLKYLVIELKYKFKMNNPNR